MEKNIQGFKCKPRRLTKGRGGGRTAPIFTITILSAYAQHQLLLQAERREHKDTFIYSSQLTYIVEKHSTKNKREKKKGKKRKRKNMECTSLQKCSLAINFHYW